MTAAAHLLGLALFLTVTLTWVWRCCWPGGRKGKTMRNLKRLLTNAWDVFVAVCMLLLLILLSIIKPEKLRDENRERPSGPGR